MIKNEFQTILNIDTIYREKKQQKKKKRKKKQTQHKTTDDDIGIIIIKLHTPHRRKVDRRRSENHLPASLGCEHLTVPHHINIKF